MQSPIPKEKHHQSAIGLPETDRRRHRAFLMKILAGLVVGTLAVAALVVYLVLQIPQMTGIDFTFNALAVVIAILMISGLLFPFAAIFVAGITLFMMPYLQGYEEAEEEDTLEDDIRPAA